MKKISKSGAKKKAWKSFAKFIKARDSNKEGLCSCISCGVWMRWDSSECHAGHFVAGRGNAVLFDEEIVYAQCCGCNMFRSGEQAKFAIALKRRNGYTDEQIEEMLNRRNKVLKYSTADYLRIAEEYSNKSDAIIRLKNI